LPAYRWLQVNNNTHRTLSTTITTGLVANMPNMEPSRWDSQIYDIVIDDDEVESGEPDQVESNYLRKCLLHIPSNYNAQSPAPLIVALHGKGQTPAQFEDMSRLSDESVNPDAVVAYPQGTCVRASSLSHIGKDILAHERLLASMVWRPRSPPHEPAARFRLHWETSRKAIP
jgi:hypothetical protein